MSLTIRHKYIYFHSTVQRAKDRRQKFHFCRLPFNVRPRNVKLNLSNNSEDARFFLGFTGTITHSWLTNQSARIGIGNRMNTSAFRDLWARVMFWKFSLENCTSRRRVQFENFQNITRAHKSRNARAGSYDFLFIIFSTKLLTRYFVRVTYREIKREVFEGFWKNSENI